MLLQSFDASASPAAVVDVLRRDGGVIVRELAPLNLIDACAAELQSSFDACDESQRTDFSGSKTLRCGGVLRYAPSCAELIAHQRVLDVADAILLMPLMSWKLNVEPTKLELRETSRHRYARRAAKPARSK